MQYSIVDMNNNALSHFLREDFEKAKHMLEIAYELCQKRLEHCEGNTDTWDQSSSCVAHYIQFETSEDIDDEDECTWDDDDESMIGKEVLDHDNRLMGALSSSLPKDDNHDSSPTAGNRPDQALESDWNSTDTTENPFHGPLPCCLPSTASPVSSTPTSSITIYNRGLVLSPADEADKQLVRTASIVLYNLALINHNIGIRCGVSNALWEALQLYEKSLEILDRHMPRHHHSSPTSASLSWIWRILDVEKLLLALLNNMGNIHAHLFHLENTNACMKSLRLVLDAATATSRLLESNEAAIVMDEDYIFFLLNSLFQGKELCFAPAA